ncbi:ABC transporter ATP-binding protein [Thiobacillus sp.]|uniref:ABC transporter ATP-binding protein n=1 Tax=Thiobacillus sp. TaxID=924 RepID=UPI0017E2EB44|nr:ABC transporter ATP-binding protein [Thiobacillus sp.]MBC2732056.1 ABC transporter ATP-binding protein [Thiobacillus sp.]MBC2740794.1 ABC transporter ATP-binding protein [Thiobacillus sp.]MBC2759446.1 ABC transporter ATP-binding protein [Thiobacillus sp.]
MNRALALNPQAVEAPASQDALLEVSNLTLRRGKAVVLDGVSLALHSGETLGLIGESGAGKSTLAMALIGLLRAPEVQLEGSMRFRGTELVTLREADYRRLRGNKIGLIFQDATAALNPCFTVGEQIAEPLKRHLGLSKWDRRERAAELMHSVGIPEPALRLDAYPHELSGGMQQRVMIAIALACNPELLLADEPTSALDVTIQAQIMELILDRVRALNSSAVFVLHDLALGAQVCDRIAVMYAGQIVEEGPSERVLAAPLHPYTQGLKSCVVELGSSTLVPIRGQIPPLNAMPAGCRFAPRCPRAQAICGEQRPVAETRDGRQVACWFID